MFSIKKVGKNAERNDPPNIIITWLIMAALVIAIAVGVGYLVSVYKDCETIKIERDQCLINLQACRISDK